MADVKISELPAASALVAGDLFPAVQDDSGLVTRKATAAQIATHALGSVPNLSAASSVAGTDELLVDQSGTARKATAAQIGAYVRGLAGSVLQVVTASTSTGTNIATDTMTDTGLSGTITPASASSRVLVLVTQPFVTGRDGAIAGAVTRLVRGATPISGEYVHRIRADGTGRTYTEFDGLVTFAVLDSPGSAGAVTYKTQGRVLDADDFPFVVYQFDDQPSYITLVEVA